MLRSARGPMLVLVAGAAWLATAVPSARADVTRQDVESSIRSGIRFLESHQNADGSWPGQPGVTALATLALLTAGEPADAPHVARGLNHLVQTGPEQLNSTYAIALQAMALAAADPDGYRPMIRHCVVWLERTQIRPDSGVFPGRGRMRPFGNVPETAGSWNYTQNQGMIGDNSNTQYALLGLHAGSEAGVRVDPRVWAMARNYWLDCQQGDGGWGYKPGHSTPTTGSMTCAGISSLVITGSKLFQGHEMIAGEAVEHCGQGEFDEHLQRGMRWLGMHLRVNENPGSGQSWKYYYLYGLERAGRLTGQRFFGGHDWYREGAERLVQEQDRLTGAWDSSSDSGPIVSTSFALLFLSKGRAPVLVNKLRHAPGVDWDNDADDIRNLVGLVSKDWKNLLTWQVVDPNTARVEDMLQAPIVFFNGHSAPVFSPAGKQNLRDYVEQGGFIFADACCGKADFDRGFRALMKEIFP